MKTIFTFLLVGILNIANAQNKDVLLTVDDNKYYADEFLRVYNKNLDLVKDDSQKDLNTYLELYIGYKLKVEKAKKLQLQDNPTYLAELNSYRNQLAKNYINDSKVTTALIDEAYDRSLKEIKASHILILVPNNSNDTLAAYKKATAVYERLKAGEAFEKVALATSEDPSVKENQGDLGYFSAFRMVYPFETVAYNTPKGNFSKPFLTKFGYHILKVSDIRKNRGEVTAAHIMLLKPQEKSESAQAKVKQDIDAIYKKIQQGELFENLSAQFSEDKSSSEKGGVLPKFGSGQLTSTEFEEVAFSLAKPNDISKPFETEFGWHIVKLVEKHPIKELEKVKFELENKIKRDERSIIITNSLTEKLRKKYPVLTDKKQLQAINKAITTSYFTNEWQLPANDAKDYTLLLINNDKKVSTQIFLEYALSQQKNKWDVQPVSKLVAKLLENFTNEQLAIYFDENLENEFEAFKYVMDEYRDGLLLFDLMEREIWNKAKTDSIGLAEFYDKNKNNYMWKDRVSVTLLSSTNEKEIKKAQKLLKKGLSASAIKEKLNTKDKVVIMDKNGIFEKDYEVLPELNITKTGVTDVKKKGDYYFVGFVDALIPAQPKSMQETKGKLVNDYQQYLEENWVSALKKEFDYSVNQTTFEMLKKEIAK